MTEDTATHLVAPSTRHVVLDAQRPQMAPAQRRSLAPDLARGTLLLFIALANVWTYLYGHTSTTSLGERPADGSDLDRFVAVRL